MERATPVRKTHTSTAGLLSWPETPSRNKPSSSAAAGLLSWPEAPSHNKPSSAAVPHSNQPSDGMTQVLSGDQITAGEAESLNRSSTFRKHCSEYKLKEMGGSNIFEEEGEHTASESGVSNIASNNRTSVRIVQQAAKGISQISFSTEENLSPKKPHSLTEVAKQRELSGTLENEFDSKIGKHFSDSKSKELSGHDIFGTPSEVPPRSLAAVRSSEPKESHDMGEPAPRNIRTSVKVSNPAGGQSNIIFGEEPVFNSPKKIHNQNFAELTGNDILKGVAPPGSSEKSLSVAKLKEMSGNNIFADGKAESREYRGGVRKPPGGESSIALI